jgi:hypothetical protein
MYSNTNLYKQAESKNQHFSTDYTKHRHHFKRWAAGTLCNRLVVSRYCGCRNGCVRIYPFWHLAAASISLLILSELINTGAAASLVDTCRLRSLRLMILLQEVTSQFQSILGRRQVFGSMKSHRVRILGAGDNIAIEIIEIIKVVEQIRSVQPIKGRTHFL